MRSRLYECRVMHHRFAPKQHRFAYGMFMLAVDLDELATLGESCRLLTINGRNLFSLRESDYLPTSVGTSLRQRVEVLARSHGVELHGGRIELITLPRIAGYLFNPISLYFCYDSDGAPVAAIAEVTNTFHEVKPYFLGRPTWTGTAFHLRVPKLFYVSPFSDVDVAFDFSLRPASERLAIQIDDFIGDDRTLTSTLTGQARPLCDRALASFLFKYPLLTMRVMLLIHWHALRLWWKRVPWFPKAARASDQRGLLRPHASLRAAPTLKA